MEKIEISTSKVRILLVFVCGLLLSICGGFFAFAPENQIDKLFLSPLIIRVVGIVSLLFFGIATVFGLWKFFSRKPSLVIDDYGITDNTNLSSVGLIEWADIVSIKPKKILTERFILVFVANPNKYVKNQSIIKRMLLKDTSMTVGTPISISVSNLEYKHKELLSLLENCLGSKSNINR